LMCLISLAGAQIRNFVFAGFPPAERDERSHALKSFAGDRRAIVLMDTPYRLEKLISELAELAPDRKALLGMDFTLPTETILDDSLKQLQKLVIDKKAEFMLLLYPLDQTQPIKKSPPIQSGKKRFTPGRRKRP
jgi:16S rRNA (cytidine1402-2'-O)-methyltransferase